MAGIKVFSKAGSVVTVPTPNLRDMFLKFDAQHFENTLVSSGLNIELEWNTRLRTCAGRCRCSTCFGKYLPKKIELSYETFRVINFKQSEVDETMIHEMCHAYIAIKHNELGHGWRFQSKMASIMKDGRSDYTFHHIDVSSLRNKSRW